MYIVKKFTHFKRRDVCEMLEQQNMKLIDTHSQLKVISDPFKNQVLYLLVEKAYTGQQLSKILEVARSKVHYALTELENNELIHIVRKEEKNGIIQKFYKAVAKKFILDEQLIPQSSDSEDYYRSSFLNILSRAKIRTLSAPEEAFQYKNPKIGMQLEAKVNEEEFKNWLERYKKLIEEFEHMKDDKGKFYYLTTIGFQIDEPLFDGHDEDKDK